VLPTHCWCIVPERVGEIAHDVCVLGENVLMQNRARELQVGICDLSPGI
jgi:hypothetical protein